MSTFQRARATLEALMVPLLVALFVGTCSAQGRDADRARFGLFDDCKAVDGWRGQNLEGDGEHLVVQNASRGSRIRKTYPPVDLDRYHYAIIHIRRKSMPIRVRINGVDTPLAYTTGPTAIDLKYYDNPRLRGKQPVEVVLWFGGRSTARQEIDWLGLATSLSPKEKSRLGPRPLDWREEKLTAKPYHDLQALKARSNAPLLDPQEQAIFRDTATGAVTTRITASPTPEFLDEAPCWGSFGYPWNADGSVLKPSLAGQRAGNLIDLHRGVAFEGLRSPRTLWHPEDPDVMYVLTDRTHLWRYNWRTRKREFLCEVKWEGRGWVELWLSYKTGKIMLSLRTTPECYVIDPKAPAGRRATRHRLRNLKLAHLGGENEELLVWNSQGQGIMCRELATGRDLPGSLYSTAHTPYGRFHNIQRHDLFTWLKVPRALHHTSEYEPGDRITIWAHYAKPLFTDYGALTLDEQWVVTNGYHRAERAKDVFSQHVMVSAKDPATVLRLAWYYTSFRNHPTYSQWNATTYNRASPDYTKVVFVSDVMGNPDLWMVQTRRPDPVRNLRVRTEGVTARLGWDAPERSREVRHYNIYWTDSSGRNYRRINENPVTERSFVVPAARTNGYFSVTAVEHSRLEGLYSDEVALPKAARRGITRYIEAARCELAASARMVFDGDASDYRYVRITPATPVEKIGAMTYPLSGLPRGRYVLWVRVRGKGSWHASLGGRKIGTVTSVADRWQWVRVPGVLALEKRAVLSFASSDVKLRCDGAVLSSAPNFTPEGVDERDTAPPAAPEGFAAQALGEDKVRLTWNPSPEKNVRHYSVYVGDDPAFLVGNASVIRSLFGKEIVDKVPEGKAQVVYKLVAIDHRGHASAPVVATVVVKR